jgi:TPR repeat protein
MKIGDRYYTGREVPKNFGESMIWYRKAAELGNTRAQLTLGLIYWDNPLFPEGNSEAAKWFRMAADQGDAEGQLRIGVLFSRGEGVA